ncbi:MAG: SusC/RagA family TonB-linked outer membrane protein [Chitinophagaceae bacterium]|nr:SusC/RagA family TonB-linked outer membrane protein [Chitinophagaceae bacterium]
MKRLRLLALTTFAIGCLSLSVAAQQTIKGTLRSSTGEPLPGATITVKGTNRTVVTDAGGAFSIQASPNDVLVATYVGYTTQETAIGSDPSVGITLNATTGSMNEVVVIGYGTTSRKNLTVSVAKIDPKVVPQAANSSVAQLIFGRAAGVNATQLSAEPGGNINISIRGRGNPLVVIDGVVTPYAPLEPGNSNIANELNNVRRGGFAGLSPSDIESIEFLKDASAAIYGLNAANGVVLITTKKGKAGRLSVSYDGSRSYVKNMKYLEPLTASEYLTYYNQLTLDKYLLDKKMAPFGPNAPGGFVPRYNQSDIRNAGEGTDWLSLVLRDGAIDNHNLSVSGGSDKTTYFFSGNFFNQIGTVRKSSEKRYTGRMNLNFALTDFLSLGVNVSGAQSEFENSTAGWTVGGAGAQSFGALQAAVAYPRSVSVYDAAGKYSLFQVTGNPVSLLDIKDLTSYNSVNAIANLDVKIIGNKLTGRLLYGNLTENSVRDFFVPTTTFYFQLFQSRGSWNQSKRQNQTMEGTLNFKEKFFGGRLNFDAVGGIGQYQYDETGFGAAATDMLDAIGTDNLSSGTSTSRVVSSNRGYSKTRSYFARTGFDLFDKYVIQLTYRYDGFNNFFPQYKYSSFPSGSIAWKLSNESFLKNVSFINLLKLRGSIGVTGVASGYAYGFYTPDNSVISFNSGGTQTVAYTIGGVDHPDLQWPKTINKNLGLDFSLFTERISGSFDWFRDDITRLISNATTAPLNFLGTQPVNGAHRVRTGWEVGINTRNVSNKIFQWNSIINVSRFLFRHEERFPFEAIPKGGKVDDPVNSIYVFKTSGILQVGQAIPNFQPVNAQQPGAPIFIDINGDKKLDTSDIVRYNGDPYVTIGFGNVFSYKQFDLSVMFYGQLGAWGYNNLVSWASAASLISGIQSGIKETKDIWSTTNPSGTIPGVAYDPFALGLPAGINTTLEKRDFIRCRNLTLGYTLSGPSMKYLRSLRLFVDLQNPFVITKFKIADPEVQVGAVKGGAAPYPMARTYSLGLKANF